MKILVPVKQVASFEEQPAIDSEGGLASGSVQWQLNEWDTFSLEAALQLAESEPGSEVIVATVGEQTAEEGLLSCLAKGADRAVRVSGVEPDDPLLAATVLAALARRESPDLILCGVQSADAANAATGVALAGLLDLARVAVVTALERDGDGLRVDRELDGGVVEVLSVPLPALLTIQTGANEPRYASLRSIKQARGKPLDVVEAGELGLGAEELADAAGARRVRLHQPQRGESARMLDGGPGEIAAQIVEILRREVGP
ncbi:MAG: electron transfer flavoprotein subunit beta/FixA family protein [Solirubrobacteraceae bacterium]